MTSKIFLTIRNINVFMKNDRVIFLFLKMSFRKKKEKLRDNYFT